MGRQEQVLNETSLIGVLILSILSGFIDVVRILIADDFKAQWNLKP